MHIPVVNPGPPGAQPGQACLERSVHPVIDVGHRTIIEEYLHAIPHCPRLQPVPFPPFEGRRRLGAWFPVILVCSQDKFALVEVEAHLVANPVIGAHFRLSHIQKKTTDRAIDDPDLRLEGIAIPERADSIPEKFGPTLLGHRNLISPNRPIPSVGRPSLRDSLNLCLPWSGESGLPVIDFRHCVVLTIRHDGESINAD